MVGRADLVHFRNALRSVRSMMRVLNLLGVYCIDRMRFHRGAHLVLGNALAARLLKSLVDLNVPIRLGTAVVRLVLEGGRGMGVEVRSASGEIRRIKARHAVILAAGGFSHSPRLRALLLPPQAGNASAAAEGNTGDGLELGRAVGGVVIG